MKNLARTLIAIACYFPTLSHAQTDMFSVGAAVPVFLKINAGVGSQGKNAMNAATGIDLALQMKGVDERAMSFLQMIGITDDKRSFQPEAGTKITTGLFFLNVNPTILIPSKWDNIKYNVGVGALINLGQSEEFSTSTQSSGTLYTSDDSVGRKIAEYSRNIIPFISLAVTWEIKKHFRAQFLAEPTLLNFYQPDSKINYNINYAVKAFPLSYQPLYFGIRFFYFFRK